MRPNQRSGRNKAKSKHARVHYLRKQVRAPFEPALAFARSRRKMINSGSK